MNKVSYTLGLPPATGPDELVSLDFEIFGQDGEKMHRPNGDLACLAIGTAQGNYVVTDLADVRETMKRVRRSTLAMQHALYDLRYFRKFGVDTDGLRVWDDEVADHVRHAGLYDSYSLAALARRELGLLLDKTVRMGFAQAHPLSPAELRYAATDAQVTREIALRQIADMEAEEVGVYWEIQAPALLAILDMGGMRVDQAAWTELADHYTAEAKKLVEELGINVNSPDQIKKKVKAVLNLDLPDAKKETLESYANFDLIAKITAAKQASKNASSWGRAWLNEWVEADGLVYPDVLNNGAETDRWAVRRPNVQQIPVRKAPRYRHCFIPTNKNEVILSMDADQQEPRILAYFSRDPRLLQALQSGIKTHLMVAREIHNDNSITKTDPRYRIGKDVNLGIAYGMSEYGLAARYHMTLEAAKVFIDRYFERLAGVAVYIEQTRASAYRLGYVRSATQMKGWLNLYTGQWRRSAINTRIQMTAAHITKLAIRYFHEETRAQGLPFCLTMAIHDELLASVPKRLAKRYEKIMQAAWMEAAAYVIPGIPFATDTWIGATWGKEE